MHIKKEFLVRLFILLFTISASVTIISCSSIVAFGLFGEVKSSTVKEDDSFPEELKKQTITKTHKSKGKNIINLWYELWYSIVCMIFVVYTDKLPGRTTIVSLKIRMNN